ncbi:MAG: hypothetical protein ACREEM_11465 [Blastocatellia bacterium]
MGEYLKTVSNYEFFVSPDDYYPILLLILCEIAYPSLLIANQDAILLLISHDGAAHRVILWRQGTAGAVPRRKQEELAEHKNVNVYPLQCLGHLLVVLDQSDSEGKSGLLDWLSLDPEKSDPLHRGLLKGLKKWLDAHGDIDNKVHYSGPDDSADTTTEHYLPTIYIRLLLNVACWWLFYGASQTIKKHTGNLWRRRTAEMIIKLLEKELDRLSSVYFPHSGVDVRKQDFGMESDHPLPNAILWLAFVHDFIVHSVNSSAQSKERKSDVGIPEKVDPLNIPDNDESDIPASSYASSAATFQLRFDELTRETLPKTQVIPPNVGNANNLSYWEKRLDLLEKLNDRYFPDEHLLSAWRFFFELIEQPKIAMDTDQDPSCDSDYAVKWASWLSDRRKVDGSDKWMRLDRKLREAPAIARLWVAPLTSEAISKFTTPNSNSKKWNFKTTGLRKRLEELRPGRKQGLSTIERIARDAIAGFPLELDPSQTDSTPPSAFIAFMQSKR